MRLDRFLWFARLAKTRSFAQALAEQRPSAHRRPPRSTAPHAPVRVGNVLTFATHDGEVRVIRVEALPPPRPAGRGAGAAISDLEPELRTSRSKRAID